MFSGLYAKLGGLALVAAALLGLFLWGHHAGVQARAAKDAAAIEAKDQALRAAAGSLSAAADALHTVDAQAKANAAEAVAQKAKADKAASDAEASKTARADAEKAWRAKFDQLKQSTGCKAVLEQTLCPALSGY